ncbi:MAG: hypothetical protein QJR08_05770 [Bacillota bacterium]|nr:hypothetical protein [Bacillota bacterium]
MFPWRPHRPGDAGRGSGSDRDDPARRAAARRRDLAGAQRVLGAAELPVLGDVEPAYQLGLAPDEEPFVRLPAALLRELEEGEQVAYEVRERGRLVVTSRRLFFEGAESTLELELERIERAGAPFLDVLEVALFRGEMRDVLVLPFQVEMPVTVAAFLARLAGFQLELG